MNIRITGDGDLNLYYVQTLCLLYFPGEGFKSCDNTRWCQVHIEKNSETSSSTVQLGDSSSGVFYVGRGSVCYSELAPADRDKADKISCGVAFMEAAQKLTGYTPPWGILTGVRPARVVSALIDSGMTADEAAEYLVKVYKVSFEKATLAASVSVTENRVVSKHQKKECSIYIAIPFCPSRCRYCSFVSVSSPGLLKLIPDYIPALKKDIKNITDTIKSLGLHIASVYIGGGTPSILTADQIRDLLDYVNTSVGSPIPEFTFEAGRPDTITMDKLTAIAESGVTRISVNTQTLNNDILANIGRNHTAEQFFEAYSMARNAGIKHVNVDLIAGLPGENSESFISAASRITALRPEAITVHTFTVKRSSDYGLSDLYSRESMDAAVSVDASSKIITDAGYTPYYMYRQKNTVGNLENVGYSLPSSEGMYNIYMMEEVHTVFGAGASAVSRLTLTDPTTGEQIIERLFEPKYPYEYLNDHSGITGESRRQILRDTTADFYKKYS